MRNRKKDEEDTSTKVPMCAEQQATTTNASTQSITECQHIEAVVWRHKKRFRATQWSASTCPDRGIYDRVLPAGQNEAMK